MISIKIIQVVFVLVTWGLIHSVSANIEATPASQFLQLQRAMRDMQTQIQQLQDKVAQLSTSTSSKLEELGDSVQTIKRGHSAMGMANKAKNSADGSVTSPLWFVNTGNQKFTVPDNVYTMWVTGCAGGGGGSVQGVTTPKGAGGGGGQCVMGQVLHVTPGQTINITVGAGGFSTQNGGLPGGATMVGDGAIYLTPGGGGVLATPGTSGGPGSNAGGVGDSQSPIPGLGGSTLFGMSGFCSFISTGQPMECVHGGFGAGGYGGYSDLQYAAYGSSGFLVFTW